MRHLYPIVGRRAGQGATATASRRCRRPTTPGSIIPTAAAAAAVHPAAASTMVSTNPPSGPRQQTQPFRYGGRLATGAALPGAGGSDSPTAEPYSSGSSTIRISTGAADGTSAGSVTDNRTRHSDTQEGDPLPLRLVELPGKGRGVVAARSLIPGELLMMCRPLVLLQGPATQTQPPTQSPTQLPPQQHQRKRMRQPQQQPAVQRPLRPADSVRAATWSAAEPAVMPQTAAAAPAGPLSEAALLAELQQLPVGHRQAQILAFLFHGTQPSPTPQLPCSTELDLGLADLIDPWDGAWPPPAPTHGSGPRLSADQLAAAVRLNATGLPGDDVLLAKLYERPSVPFIGLWPAHAMLNHSCAPNAVAVVSGSRLLVRCCDPVAPGGEVTISYLGALGLAPLRLRRALLERNHRFRCTCDRCTAEEERVPVALAQLWGDILALTAQQLQPRLAAPAALLKGASSATASTTSGGGTTGDANSSPPPAGDGDGRAAAAAATEVAVVLPSLLDVRAQVTRCCGLFEETLGQLAPPPQEARWLQAAMYPLYETRARCAELLARATAQTAAAAAANATVAGAPPKPPPAPQPPSPPPPRLQSTRQQQQQPHQQQRQRLGQGRGRSAHGGSDQAQPQSQAQVQQTPADLAPRLGEEYLAALWACLRLQAAVNSGSDMHVQLVARYDTACAVHAARYPGPNEQLRAAEAREWLQRALGTRYGTPCNSTTAEAAEVVTAGAAPAGQRSAGRDAEVGAQASASAIKAEETAMGFVCTAPVQTDAQSQAEAEVGVEVSVEAPSPEELLGVLQQLQQQQQSPQC